MAKKQENSNILVKTIMSLLSPGANKLSIVMSIVTVVLSWVFNLIAFTLGYYDKQLIYLNSMTTLLVIMVIGFSSKINTAIAKSEEEKKEEEESSESSSSSGSEDEEEVSEDEETKKNK